MAEGEKEIKRYSKEEGYPTEGTEIIEGDELTNKKFEDRLGLLGRDFFQTSDAFDADHPKEYQESKVRRDAYAPLLGLSGKSPEEQLAAVQESLKVIVRTKEPYLTNLLDTERRTLLLLQNLLVEMEKWLSSVPKDFQNSSVADGIVRLLERKAQVDHESDQKRVRDRFYKSLGAKPPEQH